MKYASVCKNVIAANNKKGWENPDPTIRLSNTPSGKVQARAHSVGIMDAVKATWLRDLWRHKTATPVIKCGAKVALGY